MGRRRRLVAGLMALNAATVAWAADAPEPQLGESLGLRPVAPLVAVAREEGMALNGAVFRTVLTASDHEAEVAVKGSCTLVVETRGKRRLAQWLVEVAALDEDGEGFESSTDQEARLFTSTGREHTFAMTKQPVRLTAFGPVPLAERKLAKLTRDDIPRATVERAVTADFLRLGFAGFTRGWIGMLERGVETAPGLGLRLREPYPEKVTQAVAKIAAEAGWTEVDDRAYAATLPALLEFVGVIMKTPAMAEILAEVVDVPWWSVVKRGGKLPPINIRYRFERIRRVATQTASADARQPQDVYVLPVVLLLDGKPALEVDLFVRRPVGGLALVAGVIGLEARDPRDAQSRVLMRVIGVSDD